MTAPKDTTNSEAAQQQSVGVDALVSARPSNCTTCRHKFPSFNQCAFLVGATEDQYVVFRAERIRKWRETVGLHRDYDMTDVYVSPTEGMTGCPYWEFVR